MTIANGMPETRIATAPVGERDDHAADEGDEDTAGHSGTPKCSSAMPRPYAPAPKYSAWPNDSIPADPSSRLYDSASAANTMHSDSSASVPGM